MSDFSLRIPSWRSGRGSPDKHLCDSECLETVAERSLPLLSTGCLLPELFLCLRLASVLELKSTEELPFAEECDSLLFATAMIPALVFSLRTRRS